MIYTLVPLGNPGEKYARTRHNAARIVVEHIQDILADVTSLEVVTLDSYMNESGQALHNYLRYHEERELIIMYDDKDLALGTFRISYDRGDGGHNGVKSIIDALGTKAFIRLRIGIAPENVNGMDIKAPHGDEVQDFVMGKFREEELKILKEISSYIAEVIEAVVRTGYIKAMEKYNR
jgi:PTH1 family peptidyl-tRNA hydrolase